MASTSSITPNDQDPFPPTQNYCNYTSKDCTQAEKIGYFYFFTPICLIGIILNTINAIVLTGTKFKLNGSTFTYLTAMAFADLMTLCLAWPIGIMRCVPHDHTWQFYFRQVYEIYVYLPIMNSSATASVWMTVAVSVERYIFIGKSFLSMSLCSRLQAKRIILLICLCSLAINFPYFFYRRVSHTEHKIYTDWAKSVGYSVYSWFRLFLVKLIPIVATAVFNGMLVKAVWDANKRRKSLVFPSTIKARRQRMQIRTTAMLITMSIIFILCHFLEPFIHSGVYTSLFGPCSIYTETYAFLRTFVNTLEMFSFSTNFIVYCMFNKQFVAALAKKCKCKVNTVRETTTVNTIH